MAPSAISQRRTHNLLLLQKLLNLRDGASPFTLLLDTLEQTAKPIVREFMVRAKISKTKIVFVSFRTLGKPKHADVFIRAHGKPINALRQEISSHVPQPSAGVAAGSALGNKILLVFDTLHPLCSTRPSEVPTFLSSLLSPITSVIAVYHTDIPLPSPSYASLSHATYAPSPLSTLLYLATAILKVSRFSHMLAAKKAKDKSLSNPVFGLVEGREGLIFGLGDGRKGEKDSSIVIEMEIRRKSGRGVREVFVLSPASTTVPATAQLGLQTKAQLANVALLDDHPSFARPVDVGGGGKGEANGDGEEAETTFSLGLTEKQKRDREGVVLPYFDAQNGEGPGEGGRILYDMGREDDYDEDEDDEF